MLRFHACACYKMLYTKLPNARSIYTVHKITEKKTKTKNLHFKILKKKILQVGNIFFSTLFSLRICQPKRDNTVFH